MKRWASLEVSFLRVTNNEVPGFLGFFSRTISWTTVLLVVPACAQVLGGPSIGEHWTSWEVLYHLASWVGLLLPFATFAGGLKSFRMPCVWRFGLAASALALISLLLLGYASPYLQYRANAGVGVDVSQRYPIGPITLGGLRQLRTRVLENPPEEFNLSAERLLDAPPNWISYQIHTVYVLSLFAILAAFMGAVTAGLTTGLPPPARKNARWALGLASGVLFFIGESLGGDWVRADALHSGVLGAWGAMVIPVLELAFLHLLLLLRVRRRSTLSSVSPSDD